MTDQPAPLKVFISYSHKDEALKEELEVHLASLKREGAIEPWQDRDIEAGEEWDDEIRKALEAAQIILLLITPRFLASRYCFDEETRRAMERHQEGTARVIPIIIKPSDWQTSPFSKLQVLPKEGKPVTRWEDQDEAFLNVVQGIRRVVASLKVSIPATINASLKDRVNTSSNSATHSPSAEIIPSATASIPVKAPKSSTQKRLELFQLLSSLPGPTFDAIVYAVKVPPMLLPPAIAPQGQRVPALLEWAQSPVGCGLDELEAVIHAVVQNS
jgi:hypothetical protein